MLHSLKRTFHVNSDRTNRSTSQKWDKFSLISTFFCTKLTDGFEVRRWKLPCVLTAVECVGGFQEEAAFTTVVAAPGRGHWTHYRSEYASNQQQHASEQSLNLNIKEIRAFLLNLLAHCNLSNHQHSHIQLQKSITFCSLLDFPPKSLNVWQLMTKYVNDPLSLSFEGIWYGFCPPVKQPFCAEEEMMTKHLLLHATSVAWGHGASTTSATQALFCCVVCNVCVAQCVMRSPAKVFSYHHTGAN